jgi:hypothetical protein
MLDWSTKATLDVIGLAGFDYDFGALSPPGGKQNELYDAMSTVFGSGAGVRFDIWSILGVFVPFLHLLVRTFKSALFALAHTAL